MAQMKCELMSALLEDNSLSHVVRALAYSERFIIRFMGGITSRRARMSPLVSALEDPARRSNVLTVIHR